jgi:hypothetical protein
MTLSSPLRLHVGHVVCVRAEEQMVKTAAWRVIAGVADLHAGRNRTVGLLPCETMGKHRGRPGPERPVAIGRPASHPRPAVARVALVDRTPEVAGKAGGWVTVARPRTVQTPAPVALGLKCQKGLAAVAAGTLNVHQITPGVRPRPLTRCGVTLRRHSTTLGGGIHAIGGHEVGR